MYCSKCGKQINDEVKFCPSCGNSTQTDSEQETIVYENPESDSGVWIFFGIVSGIVALFFLPPLFGGLGVFLGYKAKESGNGAGGIAIMVISGACMLLGMFVGVLTY